MPILKERHHRGAAVDQAKKAKHRISQHRRFPLEGEVEYQPLAPRRRRQKSVLVPELLGGVRWLRRQKNVDDHREDQVEQDDHVEEGRTPRRRERRLLHH